MSAPVYLVVLDGWGLADPGPGNAVALYVDARLSSADLWSNYVGEIRKGKTELSAALSALVPPLQQASGSA